MYNERRPGRAEFREFYASLKRAPKSVFSLPAIEGLISNERWIPNNSVDRWNISGANREKVRFQKMRCGRTKMGTSQGHGINIHAPNLRTRITKITYPFFRGLKKYTVPTTRIKNSVVSLPYRPMNQKPSNRISGVKSAKHLLLSSRRHIECDPDSIEVQMNCVSSCRDLAGASLKPFQPECSIIRTEFSSFARRGISV